MKAPAFDAVLDFPLKEGAAEFRGEAAFLGGTVPSWFLEYGIPGRKRTPFVRVIKRGRSTSGGPIPSRSGPHRARPSGGASASFPARRRPRSGSRPNGRPSSRAWSSARRT